MQTLQAITAPKAKECELVVAGKKPNRQNHPSITAARAVHVNPMAIPIHGVWPSVPSLRTCSALVAPDDPIDSSPGRLVSIAASGPGCSACTLSICARWRPSCLISLPTACNTGSGVGGVASGSDGVAATDVSSGAGAGDAIGSRRRRVLGIFIAIERGSRKAAGCVKDSSRDVSMR